MKDEILENNELFRITAVVPRVPDGENLCHTDAIIRDNDDYVVSMLYDGPSTIQESGKIISREDNDVTGEIILYA